MNNILHFIFMKTSVVLEYLFLSLSFRFRNIRRFRLIAVFEYENF